MTSKPGSSAARRLGPYEFIGRLGAGGMGEVYRARDTRLGREVAIKMLPPEVSGDADRLRRFEKEARAASSLNHPNIVTIYEVERLDSTSFIVMELVDGKTLREVLSEGALPVRRLLTIAVQIAEGLARAHSAGIVHRDLKPENVMVTKEGLVKILDFGLAKLAHPEQDGGGLTQGPTVSGGTSPGVVMGTVGYMSPEQASGHPVDFRSDQFSFGAVLYEMATGKGPFRRATAAQTLAAIIQDEPEALGALNPKLPAPFRWIVERCLGKDPRERYASSDDLARDLASVRDHLSEVSGLGQAVAAPSRSGRLFWVLPGAVAVLLAVILAVSYLRRPARLSSPIRASLLLPEKFVLGNLALSPDGKHLAFTESNNFGPSSLWVRDLDGTAARTVKVRGDAGFPFWSPDSRFIAFFSDGKLRKVDAAGGAMQTICEAERGNGGAWAPDDTILFAPTQTSALYKVSASGGQPLAVTKLDVPRHETSHRYPFFLPDGRHFLYMACIPTTALENLPNAIRVASLEGKLDKALIPTASNAAYAAGRLLYVREGTLFARPFDLGRLEPVGSPIPIAQQVRHGQGFGSYPFGAGESVLVLLTDAPQPSTLRWFDRSGKAGAALGEPAIFKIPRLSPDGRKVAVGVADPVRNTSEIWIYDAATGVRTKLGSVQGAAYLAWSPGGDRIVFASGRKDTTGNTLFVRPINGAGEEVLLESPDVKVPEDWSPDGRFISFSNLAAQGKRDMRLWVLSMAGDRKASPLPTDAVGWQDSSNFSPDGHWIAYQSEESGVPEVYVSSFPGPGEKWQVSTAGGSSPRWRRDGRELFYLSADDKIMAVPMRLTPAFEAGAPVALFSMRRDSHYDVSADGQHFLVNSNVGEEPASSLTLITDWTALLRE